MCNENNLLEYLKDKKIYGIFDSDLDGVSAYLLALYYIKPIVKNFNFNITADRSFAQINYNYIKENDIIIFVDTSPSFELYNLLKNEYKKEIIIVDHHETSYNIYNNKINNFYWDKNQCGAELFYNLLISHIRPKRIISQYISLVSTYDLWKQDSLLWNDAKNLSNILQEYVDWSDKNRTDDNKFDNFIYNQLYKFTEYKTFFLINQEKDKAKNAEEKEKKNLKQARRTLKIREDNQKNLYLYFECDSKLSFVSNVLLREYENKNIKYCISRSMFAYNKEKRLSISVRSLNFNCEKLVKPFEGGGHQKAAGLDLTNKDENFYYDLIIGKKHLI